MGIHQVILLLQTTLRNSFNNAIAIFDISFCPRGRRLSFLYQSF